MVIFANDPNRTSWLHVDSDSDFPIQNIPFGVFLTPDDVITIGTRIGDTAIDLAALHQLGYFDDIALTDDIFLQDTLNDFIADGRKTWRAANMTKKITKTFAVGFLSVYFILKRKKSSFCRLLFCFFLRGSTAL